MLKNFAVLLWISACMTFTDRTRETFEEYIAATKASTSQNLKEFREGLELLLGDMYSKMANPFLDSRLGASEIRDKFAENLKKSIRECTFRKKETSRIKRCFKYNVIMNKKNLLDDGLEQKPYQNLDYYSGEALLNALPEVITNDDYDEIMEEISYDYDPSGMPSVYSEDEDKHVQVIISYFLRVLKKLRITRPREGVEGIPFSKLEGELVKIYNDNKNVSLKSSERIESILGGLNKAASEILKVSSSSRKEAYSKFAVESDKQVKALKFLEKEASSCIPPEKKFELFRFHVVFGLLIDTIRLHSAVIDGSKRLSGKPALKVSDMSDRMFDYASSLFLYSMCECADPANLKKQINRCINAGTGQSDMDDVSKEIDKDNKRFRLGSCFEIKDDDIYPVKHNEIYARKDAPGNGWMDKFWGLIPPVVSQRIWKSNNVLTHEEKEKEKRLAKKIVCEKEDSFSRDDACFNDDTLSHDKAMRAHYAKLFNDQMKDRYKKRIENLIIICRRKVPKEKIDLLEGYLELIDKFGCAKASKGDLDGFIDNVTMSSLGNNEKRFGKILSSMNPGSLSQQIFLEPRLKTVYDAFGIQKYNLCNPKLEELKSCVKQTTEVASVAGGLQGLQNQCIVLKAGCFCALAGASVFGFLLYKKGVAKPRAISERRNIK